MILDEVQRCPELLISLKRCVDEKRQPGRFILSGSANLALLGHVSETLAGRAAYLAGIKSIQPGDNDLLRGALYETYMAQNLAALLEAHLPDAQLAYWHEQGRHEVDFVIESGAQVIAIEVKAATRWEQTDLAGLLAFRDRTPACTAAVLAYNGTQSVHLGDRLWAIPMGQLLE